MKQILRRTVLTEKTRFPKGKIVAHFDVFMEICCDHCNDIIHNHIDCPKCGKGYASTDQYGDLYDTNELACEECGTKYRLVSGMWYAEFTAEIA